MLLSSKVSDAGVNVTFVADGVIVRLVPAGGTLPIVKVSGADVSFTYSDG